MNYDDFDHIICFFTSDEDFSMSAEQTFGLKKVTYRDTLTLSTLKFAQRKIYGGIYFHSIYTW